MKLGIHELEPLFPAPFPMRHLTSAQTENRAGVLCFRTLAVTIPCYKRLRCMSIQRNNQTLLLGDLFVIKFRVRKRFEKRRRIPKTPGKLLLRKCNSLDF